MAAYTKPSPYSRCDRTGWILSSKSTQTFSVLTPATPFRASIVRTDKALHHEWRRVTLGKTAKTAHL